MPSALVPMRDLQNQVRAYIPHLMAVTPDPHAELMAMVWGTRFDRQHAMDLWAQLPPATALQAQPLWHALYALADRFDALATSRQHSLRRLILRHRAVSRAAS